MLFVKIINENRTLIVSKAWSVAAEETDYINRTK